MLPPAECGVVIVWGLGDLLAFLEPLSPPLFVADGLTLMWPGGASLVRRRFGWLIVYSPPILWTFEVRARNSM